MVPIAVVPIAVVPIAVVPIAVVPIAVGSADGWGAAGLTGEVPLVATFTGGTLVELPKLDPALESDELAGVAVEPLVTSDPLDVAEGVPVMEPADAESLSVSLFEETLFGETLFAGSEVAAPDSRIAAAKEIGRASCRERV